jgi:subtilisin-like proprotein convertase family protein
LAWLNGLLYVQDDFIDNRITVYNPATRRVVNTLNVGSLNNINISGGLAAITGPDRLLATSTFGDTIYEINPTNGIVSDSWTTGIRSAEGLATANGEIYIGAFQDGRLNVFNRSGVFQRFVDVSLSLPEGVHALGGDNILTMIPTEFQYKDVFVGLNNKVYVVDSSGTTVARFDAATLAPEAFIPISRPVDALAADAKGNLWGAGQDGKLYKLNSDGGVLQETSISSNSLIDIDLNVTGQILLSNDAGRIYKTSTSFLTPTSFSAGATAAFVTIGKHQSLPAGDLIVQLVNSDPTEASVPAQVIIPVGQQSVTFPLDVLDDNILDGTQTVTITGTAAGYTAPDSDSISVRDAETIGVNILAPQISEAAGPAATQARVFRTDIDGPFTFVSRQVFTNSAQQTILDGDKTTSTINVPVQTSRITDVNVGISLTHSFLSDLDIYLVSPNGTRVELVTDIVSNESTMTSTIFDDAARSGILSGSAPFTGRFRPEGELLDFNDESPTGVWTLEITDDNQEDFGHLIAWTLSIETAGLAAMTVNLSRTGDTNEINAQTSVVIPANQSSILIPVNAIDDTILDGTRVAGLKAGNTVFGYLFGSDSVNVLDRETLQFTVNKTTVTETAGAAAITGTLKRLNSDLGASFTVALSSSDTSELTVPATVTIPAGSSSVTFPINAIDDSVFDGTQQVTVRAVTSQYVVATNQVISVTDVEPKLVLTSAVSSVKENSGSFIATVTRQQQTDISQPVVVDLSVSAFTGLSSPISVPATVTIPAGRTSQTFVVTVKDDRILDGTQTATILAKAAGITEDSAEFQISDYETLSLSINKTSVREDAGTAAARGTVTRSNLDVSLPLTVTLNSSDLSEIKVPATVTIPAGASSVSFNLDAVNDPEIDGTQAVTISVSASGYVGASASINVDDHEPPVVTAPAATVLNPSPTVKWNAILNALRYDVLVQNLSTGVEQLYRNILDTSLTIEQPKAEPLGIGRYRVFVRAIDQLEQPGFWSFARNFQVVTAPVFTAPKTTSTLVGGTFPEISWTAVKDADGYELIVHNLTTGKSNVISQKDLKTTSYKATEVLGSGTYRATVRAFNESNEYGNFSTALDFTVLASPVILTPVSGGTFDRSPNLSWTSVSGATTYDVIVSNAQTKAIVFRDRSVPGTNIRIPQDLPDATYTVQVRAQSGRFFGSFSASRIFSVGASPEVTSPIADQKTGSLPTFLFTSVSGAERYEIWVLNKDTNAYVIQTSNVTGTSYTPTKPLPLGEYEVTVRAISFLGDITDWSDPVSFIGGASPVISSPVNNSTTSGKPLIVWSAVDGASGYNVRIVNLANNSSVVLTGNLTSTSFTPSSSLAAGKYRVWVRAVSAQGHTSNWSTAVDVTVASNTNREGLTAFGSPVLAAILPTQAAELATSQAEIALGSRSSSKTSLVAGTSTYVEQMSSSQEITEAESLAAVTDQVMAAWDISEWWNAAPISSNHKNEAI